MKIEIEADYDTLIQRKGVHKNVRWIIQQHSFRGQVDYLTPSSWCTYVVLSEEMHEKMKSRIEDAPWNGGQTYYRKITEEHIDIIEAELAAKWNKPFWKIGDDFQHIWDNERYDMYSWDYMERHIKRVIDYLFPTPPKESE